MSSPARDETVVLVQQLRKQRGDRVVLDGVSFAIERGHVFGLIGPNGAGKTTTIKILLGLLRPDAGTVEVFGKAPMSLPAADRQRIGFLSESSLRELPDLPVTELLEYQSHFFPAWDWSYGEQLVERLAVPRGQRLYAMSEGERRKTELLIALAHRPELLILDDPALGLDAVARREILWATLAAARDDGTTILFTSHILQDVERVVDDVLVLDRGRVRVQGPLEQVLARTKRLVYVDAGDVPPVPGEVSRTRHGRDLVVVTSEFSSELPHRATGPAPAVEHLNLEEIFCAFFAGGANGEPGTTA